MADKTTTAGLLADDFDPAEILEGLRLRAKSRLGPAYRLFAPEIEAFLEHDVRDALSRAFGKAEGAYVERMVRQAEDSSRNVFQAALAGIDIARARAKAKGD